MRWRCNLVDHRCGTDHGHFTMYVWRHGQRRWSAARNQPTVGEWRWRRNSKRRCATVSFYLRFSRRGRTDLRGNFIYLCGGNLDEARWKVTGQWKSVFSISIFQHPVGALIPRSKVCVFRKNWYIFSALRWCNCALIIKEIWRFFSSRKEKFGFLFKIVTLEKKCNHYTIINFALVWKQIIRPRLCI